MSQLTERIASLPPEKQALLALRLKKQARVEQAQAITRREDLRACPLSFAQQRLWFLSQLEPDSPFYSIPAALRMSGLLDVAALEQSLNEVVRRHEVLRATFKTVDGQPVQTIALEQVVTLPCIDLGHLPPAKREAEAFRLATQEARRPFDLTREPPIRCSLLRLGEEDHVFLLAVHHIAYDGWSTGVLVREMGALYAAFANGQPSPLPDLPIQYADYAHWQRRWLHGELLERQLSYWKQALGDLPPLLELPADRPRPPVQIYHGAHYAFQLPLDLHERLKTLSRQEDATLFMTLLAAFQVLLYRYTGQADISVGTPIANRTRVELENLIGFFVNTLVMRTDLSGEPSFRQALQRVREVALGAYAHQDVPFEMLVDTLQPERNMSHTPLFQVMFDLQKAPLGSLQLGSLKLGLLETESGAAKFDIVLVLEEGDQGLKAVLEYNTDLFDLLTIRRMAGHLRTLLAGIARDPDQPISSLPLLTEAEHHQLLIEWNATATAYPRDRCVQELFESQALRQPDRIAVSFPGESLSYGELNRRATQVAHYLRKRGIGPEVRVGLCVEASLDMLVGALGILKADAAYLPLDPGYPRDRLAFVLEDAQVPVLLTQERLRTRLPSESTQIICLDMDWQLIARESDKNLVSAAKAENLAYVIYTSGSTGMPKGVQIDHSGLLNLVFWHQRAFGVSPADRATQIAGPSFDASVWEVWPYLCMGASIHIVDRETRTLPVQLRDWMVSQAITISFLPTPLAECVTLLDWPQGAALRTLLTGGDKLHHYPPPDLPFEMVNNYGPTEATVVTTSGWVALRPGANTSPSIGGPIDNTQLYILDACLNPVPVGVPGELCIAGAGLARGYLNRPELTAERFIPNSFCSAPGARLYRTGDLVRYRPDGNIEFLGRVDHQVKVRGFRIELGEIEVALEGHSAVREAVVLALDVASSSPVRGDKRLVAYVVAHEDCVVSASDLRQHLKQGLPDYMVPSAFVMMDSLPLTPNGKVDCRALPVPDQARINRQVDYVAPRTPGEQMVAGIWAHVLGVERVGLYDNFFELGGHSLLVTQVISRLRDTFGVELPLRTIFETPTVAGVAETIGAARRTICAVAGPPIQPIRRDKELPLSFAQQRLWFLDHLEPGSPLYNIPTAVRLTGSLDVKGLEKSLNEIVRRHESLRTTFITRDGQAIQVIAPELRLAMPMVDLTGLAETEREAETMRLAAEEARRPFDLAQGPLLRVTLLRLSEEEHVMLLTMHHIVSDGWSFGVLIREIANLYNAFSQGLASPLSELPVQYVDFAYWQREWLQGETLEAQLAYWKQQLGGSPPNLELPTDRLRPAMQSFHGAMEWFALPRCLSDSLLALSRAEGVTLFMTLLAAFQTLLYRYTGQADISVGSPIANRNRAEIEGLIGFFVNTLVPRTDLSGRPSFRDLLKRVREVALGAYAHQDLPFEMLVDALKPERDLSHTPLFQVMFILQNAPADALELACLKLTPLKVDSGIATCDITLSLTEEADGLAGFLEYNTDLFDGATMRRMAGHLQHLLEAVVLDPDQPISELPLLTGQEQQQLLAEWNATAADYAPDRPQGVHHLFEAQAARTPDAVALVLPATVERGNESHMLTYAELNRRANQVAHYLMELGVEPETIVGICVERSLEMFVGLLGILKAGGAYLPLDPSYPPERLAYMVHDARTPVLLMQEHVARSAQVPAGDAKLVFLDAEWEVIAQKREENPDSRVKPDNLVYVIYTSGSTGKPKGVMVSHRAVVNHNMAVAEQFELTASDRVLQFATINFDAAVEEIFPSWLTGARLVARPSGELPACEELERLVAQEGLTFLDLPTAYWHEWVSGLAARGRRLPSCLRLLVVGGEKALAERYTRWRELGGDRVTWLNTYGPTEATIIASVYRAAEIEHEVPIGRPIANVALYALDRHLQPVPIGVPGELCIGGLAAARGYLNQPGPTAEVFIPDPFSSRPGARLYRTGDLVRYRADGNLEYLGRVDNQVKIRGFRVEPGEIESVLNHHPGLREVAVVVRDDANGRKRLIAYIVPQQAPAPSTSALRSFLKEHLPEYMIPTAFMELEALPLTPSGKVDRRALPDLDQSRPELEDAYTAPRTREEQILSSIWGQVLGIELVGVHDDFFELGGDSILSIQVVARANQAGLQLSPRQLFQHPTVAGLAAIAGSCKAAQAMEQGVVEGPVPLTPIQRWFFTQDLPDAHHWNQAVLLEVHEPLEPGFLEQAVKHLLEHHDALRLRFTCGADGWEQVNAGPGGALPFEWVDLSKLDEAAQRQALERRAAELQRSLDLALGPLMRVAYFDLGRGQPARLLIIVHHLAVDGLSWRILLEDLQTVYGQQSRGEAVRLPLKTTSFQHWACSLHEHAQTEMVRHELAHWVSLTNASMAPLPVDFPRDSHANTEASARTVKMSLTCEETQALLREVPAAYGTEITDVLLAALAQAVAQWTGSQTLWVDLEGHGREPISDDLDMSRTVGWFTTVYPVLLKLEGAQEPGQALKAIKEQLRQVPRRGIGYGLLRYLSEDERIRRQMEALPHPQLIFNYLGQFNQPTSEASLFRRASELAGPERSSRGTRSHLLIVSGLVIEGRLHLEWTYSEDIHYRNTVEEVAASFMQALRALIAHCQSPEAVGYTPSDFPDADLSQEDIELLLVEVAGAG